MAITDENGNGFYMPVAPAANGGMFGGNGGDWFAWIILVMLIGGGGWGFGGLGMGGMMPWLMGGMGAGMGAGFGLDYLYPWLNNSQHISDGFRDQQISSQLGDIQLGLAGINQNICQTGNGITGAVRDGFASAEIAANGRQMANMQTAFGLQSQLAQCCCDNKAGLADLKYTIAAEECATRQANAADTQRVLDKLCQLELDGVKGQLAAKDDIIAQLRQENLYARGQASQTAQTAELRQSGATQLNQLVSELRSCPIPAQPVYGSQPIFTCPQGQNTGCGCGAFAN